MVFHSSTVLQCIDTGFTTSYCRVPTHCTLALSPCLQLLTRKHYLILWNTLMLNRKYCWIASIYKYSVDAEIEGYMNIIFIGVIEVVVVFWFFTPHRIFGLFCYFIIQLNQMQSLWRWRQCLRPKHQTKTNTLHSVSSAKCNHHMIFFAPPGHVLICYN